MSSLSCEKFFHKLQMEKYREIRVVYHTKWLKLPILTSKKLKIRFISGNREIHNDILINLCRWNSQDPSNQQIWYLFHFFLLKYYIARYAYSNKILCLCVPWWKKNICIYCNIIKFNYQIRDFFVKKNFFLIS